MANYIENFKSTTDWGTVIVRSNQAPLDRSSIFSSLEDAKKYAKGDGSDSRELGKTAYIGQEIAVYENGNVNVYQITEERDLVKVLNEVDYQIIDKSITDKYNDLSDKLNTLTEENTTAHSNLSKAINALDTKLNEDISVAIDGLNVQNIDTDDNILILTDGIVSSELSFKRENVNNVDSLILKGKNGQSLGSVPVADFVKDGMLANVELKKVEGENTKFVFTFNTDSGKQKIEIDVEEFLNADEVKQVEDAFNVHKSDTTTAHFDSDTRNYLNNVRSERPNLTDNLTSIENNISTISSDVQTNANLTSQNAQAIKVNETNIRQNATKISDVSNSLNELRNDVTDLSDKVLENEKVVSNGFNVLKDRISEIERVTSIMMNNLQDQINSLNQKIDNAKVELIELIGKENNELSNTIDKQFDEFVEVVSEIEEVTSLALNCISDRVDEIEEVTSQAINDLGEKIDIIEGNVNTILDSGK